MATIKAAIDIFHQLDGEQKNTVLVSILDSYPIEKIETLFRNLAPSTIYKIEEFFNGRDN